MQELIVVSAPACPANSSNAPTAIGAILPNTLLMRPLSSWEWPRASPNPVAWIWAIYPDSGASRAGSGNMRRSINFSILAP
jgi:hypothetical protein